MSETNAYQPRLPQHVTCFMPCIIQGQAVKLNEFEGLVEVGQELSGWFAFALRPQHCTPAEGYTVLDGCNRGYVAMKPSPGCRQHFDGDKRYYTEKVTLLSIVPQEEIEDVTDLYEEAMSTGCPPNADNSILLRWAASRGRIDQVRALLSGDPGANPYACGSQAILEAYENGNYDIAAELNGKGYHIQRFWKRHPNIKQFIERAGRFAAACAATVATAVVLKEMIATY